MHSQATIKTHHLNRAPQQIPEARYAYYRRCPKFRRNGVQCKAPAMKGECLCYMHDAQASSERRRVEFRRSLNLPEPWGPGPAMQRALQQVALALIDGRIDDRGAGQLLWEMRRAVTRRLPKTIKGSPRHNISSSPKVPRSWVENDKSFRILIDGDRKETAVIYGLPHVAPGRAREVSGVGRPGDRKNQGLPTSWVEDYKSSGMLIDRGVGEIAGGIQNPDHEGTKRKTGEYPRRRGFGVRAYLKSLKHSARRHNANTPKDVENNKPFGMLIDGGVEEIAGIGRPADRIIGPWPQIHAEERRSEGKRYIGTSFHRAG